MCNLHTMTKSDFLELSQSEKRKPKRSSKKNTAKRVELVSFEWSCTARPIIINK